MSENKKTVLIYKRKMLAVSETFIRDQAIAINTSDAWKPVLFAQKKDKNGITVPGIEQVYKLAPFNFMKDVLAIFNTPYPSLRKAIKCINPDLIHIHFGTQAVDIWPTFKALNLPTIVTLHGTDINLYKSYWESGKKGLAGKFYPARLLAMAKHPNVHIVAVSEAIKKRAIEYGVPADKITVSYIGIDTEKFKPNDTPVSQRSDSILFIGRFIENKGPDLLIRAFAQVQKKLPNAELIMVGEGPLLNDCKILAKSLNANVTFAGKQSSSEIAHMLGNVKAFCLPSKTISSGASEGLGMVLLEAMASGVPCITSARGGAGEAVINNKTGLCFKENDLEALSNQLLTLLTDNKLLEKFAAAGLERAQSVFDNRKTTPKLLQLYNSALEQHQRRG